MHPRERLDCSPMEGRPPLKLPDGVRLVIWPVLALEDWDMSRPMARMVISPPQGQPMQPEALVDLACTLARHCALAA